LVYDRVYSSGNVPFILGPSAQPKDEYIFISNLQQFRVSAKYVHYTKLCQLLNVPMNTKVIQIHFTELQKLLMAIQKI
jgi:hypothetical protein